MPTIEVDESPLKGALWVLFRQTLLVVGGWAVSNGYVTQDIVEAAGGVAAILFATAYGQIKGWFRHKDLVSLASLVPNSVAKVK